MEKLRLLFEGYSCMEPRPSCFVLMGNFLSQPVGTAGVNCLSRSHNNLRNAHWILVLRSRIEQITGHYRQTCLALNTPVCAQMVWICAR